VSGPFCYLVVADPDFPIRISYAFLDDVETQYLRTKTPNVKNLLKDRMAYFNNLKNDKIASLKTKIDDVRGTMIENIGNHSKHITNVLDKVLERGESLDVLLERTDDIKDSAEVFKKGTVKLKHAMIKRNIIIAIIIIVFVLVSNIFISISTTYRSECSLQYGQVAEYPSGNDVPYLHLHHLQRQVRPVLCSFTNDHLRYFSFEVKSLPSFDSIMPYFDNLQLELVFYHHFHSFPSMYFPTL
jgi:hypothetical protein